MGRYFPSSPTHDQIHEDYRRDEHARGLEALAIDYIQRFAWFGAEIMTPTKDTDRKQLHQIRSNHAAQDWHS